MRRLAILLLPALLAYPACGDPVHVEDDLDFEFFRARLHTPYVIGARVNIRAWRDSEDPLAGWSAAAVDPSVFAVDGVAPDGDVLHLTCRAAAPGETDLIIRDEGGAEATRRSIRVERPDVIRLVPAGLIKVVGDDAPPLDPADPVRILAGGMATFEVHYYSGQERLFGNGTLDASSHDASLLATPDQTFLFENREWLRLEPVEVGIYGVTLSVDGEPLATVTVEGVPESDIQRVEVMAETTRGAEDEDLLYLLARAYDSEGGDIWGVDFDWSVDEAAEPGEGDLFYYYYLGDSEAVVRASRAGLDDEVVVHMSEGGVTSSNSIGCQTTDGEAGLLALLLALIFLALRMRASGRTR